MAGRREKREEREKRREKRGEKSEKREERGERGKRERTPHAPLLPDPNATNLVVGLKLFAESQTQGETNSNLVRFELSFS